MIFSFTDVEIKDGQTETDIRTYRAASLQVKVNLDDVTKYVFF